jgi:phosphoadenosine phosphosulfate reductase
MAESAMASQDAQGSSNFARSELRRLVSSGAAESMSAPDILIWALKNFSPRIAQACSFGAPEGMVLLDMMHHIDPAARAFVLDTGRLPQATYDLMDRVRDRYGKQVEVVFPHSDDVETMVKAKGANLFYESVENRQECCRVRKVEPLNRYLAGLDAWVTGLRRDQGVTRADTPKLEIADWTRDQVDAYVREHSVPVNRLHSQGYPSVGCEPCSRAVGPGDDPRSGRWWWENADTRECGIHTDEQDQGAGI